MASPFLAEIVMFGGNFNPRQWAFCDGQLLAISQNQALFSLLGTTYGGDGRTTFALPEMRGRVAMHAGSGPGLTPRTLGERSGSETNTLNTNQLPSHSHPLVNNAVDDDANNLNVSGNALANGAFYSTDTPDTRSLPAATGNTGANQAVNNLQPYTCVNFIIATQGIFPSRN
ncbi:MAG: tail fiber protein [Xanthomonadales bacterium]|nr:tail fiber protein [Xanthomonadales bacterium]